MTEPILRLDIVIPCAGRVADLLRLLDSLQRCCTDSLARHVASITVTDDRPSQALHDQLAQAHPQVRYVHGPACGPAANRNNGARMGTAPWLLFLDDDCYVESDLIDAYVRALAAAPDTQVLEGSIHPVGERPNGNHHAPLNLDGGHLWSCNLMLMRAVFDRLGGFDEEFPYACMEDVDFRERLLAAQARVVFARAAAVYHPWRSIAEREVTKQIISHAIYAEKHQPFADQWRLLHLLRATRGRVRLYRSGRGDRIPASKYRTAAYNFLAPLIVYAVVRIVPLRRAVWRRYRNSHAESAMNPQAAG